MNACLENVLKRYPTTSTNTDLIVKGVEKGHKVTSESVFRFEIHFLSDEEGGEIWLVVRPPKSNENGYDLDAEQIILYHFGDIYEVLKAEFGEGELDSGPSWVKAKWKRR